MRVTMHQAQTSWDESLPFAVLAANNTPSMYTYTPAQIHFGNSKLQHALIHQTTRTAKMTDYKDVCTSNYETIAETVRKARSTNAQKRADLINKHRQSKVFAQGDLVWLKSLAVSPNRAIKAFNKGPLIVLQKIHAHTYKLAKLDTPNQCHCIAHANHMQPYTCLLYTSPSPRDS